MRTCIGCRARDNQAVLLRMVRSSADGIPAVIMDERRRLAGRGAWLHPRRSCMEVALKRKAFHRAFRGVVDTANVEADFHYLLESSRLRTVTNPLESGLEN